MFITKNTLTTHNIWDLNCNSHRINSILSLYDTANSSGTLIIYSNEFYSFLTEASLYPNLKLMLEDDFIMNHDIHEYVYDIVFISYQNSKPTNDTVDKINQILKYYGNDSLRGIGRTTRLIDNLIEHNKDCIYFCRNILHANILSKEYITSKIIFKSICYINNMRGQKDEFFIDHAARLNQKQYNIYRELNFKAKMLKQNKLCIAHAIKSVYYKIENSDYVFYIHNDIWNNYTMTPRKQISYELTAISECVYDKKNDKIIKYRNSNQMVQMLDVYYGITI